MTDIRSIARWLAPVRDLDLSLGGSIELEAVNDQVLCASVKAIETGRLLVLDWEMPGEEPSIVRLELRPDGEGTLLQLDHRLIDARVGMLAMSRWETHLIRLEELLGEAGPR